MVEKINSASVAQQMNRRDLLAILGAGAVAALATAFAPGAAWATRDATARRIAKLTGGAQPWAGRISLKLPKLAENGSTVRVTVALDSPMSATDYVKKIALLADQNPLPDVALFELSPANGKAEVTLRIRLAKSQNVIAIAQMSDGTFQMIKKPIEVTIGGCYG